ncbi:NAD-dependent epimerase/dehydratase family protein [Bdellovibrio sp. HCB2-146]|uniref:NAD-dependent epimerase/dehydratase family protein n=1 Tax=Bdellovibrio sp. HCB2-146 TaxID=3394362 RepID=UPI0039BC89A5
MKVLITGVLGYVGSGLLDLIPESEGLDRHPGSSFQSCISDFKIPAGVETVIHLADRRLEELNAENLEHNISLHEKFIRQLEQHPSIKRVIFSSSCSVYGYQSGELTEESSVMATSFYAKSKLAVENLLQTSSLPYVICRFGTAFGVSQPMRWDLLPNAMGKHICNKEPIELYDPNSMRPYTHVSDIRRGLVFALERAPLRSVLNFAGENVSKTDLLDQISSSLQKRPLRVDINTDKKDVRHYCVSSKAVCSQGFSFQNSIQSEFSRWKEIYAKN